ncbi:MAG: hypothetical protein K2K35_12305, partial [Lachnospiraceae bacterium]|nr:hypothetical protein [Lachnospiraceae bacterium]
LYGVINCTGNSRNGGNHMEHLVSVNVLKEDKSEEEVEIYFETDDFEELVEPEERIAFIKEQVKKQYEDARKVYFTKKDLKELQKEIDDINDTSDWHNDETFDEFMEHEDFY